MSELDCQPLPQNTPFYTAKPLVLEDGTIVEDFTQPQPDANSLCAQFGNITVNDLCEACHNEQLFVFAHAADLCLKEMGPEVYVREIIDPTSLDVPAGIYDDQGYQDKLIIGPVYLDIPDEEKNMRKIELEFDAIEQPAPAMMNVRIGVATTALDPNLSGTTSCGIRWTALKPKALNCQLPSRTLHWAFWFTGRMLYVELSTSGLGGGYNLSRIGMEIRALPRSTTS